MDQAFLADAGGCEGVAHCIPAKLKGAWQRETRLDLTADRWPETAGTNPVILCLEDSHLTVGKGKNQLRDAEVRSRLADCSYKEGLHLKLTIKLIGTEGTNQATVTNALGFLSIPVCVVLQEDYRKQPRALSKFAMPMIYEN